MEKTGVLPQGVNFFSFRGAYVGGIDQKYNSGSQLYNQGDLYSTSFDIQELKNFATPKNAERLNQLTDLLNGLSTDNVGDRVSSGTLKFHAEAELKYVAPIYARGITSHWTLGIAVPIINFQARGTVTQTGSNIEQIKKEYQSLYDYNQDFRDGLNELSDMKTQFNKALQEKGYDPIGETHKKNDTFIGDIQILNLYDLGHAQGWAGTLKFVTVLPTGPQDNPDDLLDLSNQHQTALGLGYIQDLKLWPRWVMGSSVNGLMRLPDNIEKRVPTSRNDKLPGPETKEGLRRDLGDQVSVAANLRYQLLTSLEVGGGYELGSKEEDKYSGSRGYDYSLLGESTYQSWQKIIISMEYSSVNDFLSGAASMPMGVSYDYSDVVAGINIERQQVHELNIKVYF